MNIPQLLPLLNFAADDEIIKSRLPHVSGLERFFPQSALVRPSLPSQLPQHTVRKTLLQNLYNGGLRTPLRLTD
jgi:hypothetical protein